ncbi:MAG: hypothetical protein CVT49_03350 [candidate division Zixibacteria bacterium HGW-Zixibacteria-1]|nr:MAG: hypothetical protein CVT49_03350 [candidate division Zixibacteria bacterium HGW-Zixibacteria-1]
MKKHHIIKTMSEYMHLLENEYDSDNDILFRGQNIDKPLLPKIARIKMYQPVLAREQKMFTEFIRQSTPFLGSVTLNAWDWLALAQHHGMATRLLDWTINPLAALWFAVGNPPLKDQYGVIWAFETLSSDFADLINKDPFKIKRTRLFKPRNIDARISAQGGWFTAHSFDHRLKIFTAFEKTRVYKKRLSKIIIPAEEFSSIRRELDRCGYNPMTMFPGLDGLCQHIQWQNSFLADED